MKTNLFILGLFLFSATAFSQNTARKAIHKVDTTPWKPATEYLDPKNLHPDSWNKNKDRVADNMALISDQESHVQKSYEVQTKALASIFGALQKSSSNKYIVLMESQKEKQFSSLKVKVNSGKFELRTCSNCNGNPVLDHKSCTGTGKVTCYGCKGSGKTLSGNTCGICIAGRGYSYCNSCSGTGVHNCTTCRGTGIIAINFSENKSPTQNDFEQQPRDFASGETSTHLPSTQPKKSTNANANFAKEQSIIEEPIKIEKKGVVVNDNEIINGKKLIDIKYWVLEKIASSNGGAHEERVTYNEKDGPKGQIKYLLNYDQSNKEVLIIDYSYFITSKYYTVDIKQKKSVTWENIKSVELLNATAIDSIGVTSGLRYHHVLPERIKLTFYIPIQSKSNEKITYFEDPSWNEDVQKDVTDKESFIFFPNDVDETVPGRLINAFSDLIGVYKKKKAKDLY